jgi:glycosyltransferase involved in cell wall biosynthesis
MVVPILKLWKKGGLHDVLAIHSLEGAFYVLLRILFKSLPPCVIISFGSDEQRWELEKEEERLGFRSIPFFSKIFYYLFMVLQARFATRHADHVIVAARTEISFYTNRYRMPAPKITFIPNGVSQDYFLPRTYAPKATKLLFLGGWEWRKGTRYLIEAFIKISKKYSDVTLTLAGVGDSAEAALSSFPDPVRSRVRVLSTITLEESPKVYQNHDIFVFPSLFESMSLVVPEAMASGMPVITTRACGMQDIIRDNENGLLVPPRDSHAIEVKISELIENSSLRQKLGDSARKTAQQELLWGNVSSQFEKVFVSLTEKSRSK